MHPQNTAPKWSLKWLLMIGVTLLLLLLGGIIVRLSYEESVRQVQSQFDAQMQLSARFITDLAHERREKSSKKYHADEDDDEHEEHDKQHDKLSSPDPLTLLPNTLFAAWNKKGQLMIENRGAENSLAFSEHWNFAASPPALGFSTLTHDLHHPPTLPNPFALSLQSVGAAEQTWRVYWQQSRRKEWVLVAQPWSVRQDSAWRIAMQVAQPFLWVLPLAIVLLNVLIWFALRPLYQLTDEVQKRDPKAIEPFAAPLAMKWTETQPLVLALNHWLNAMNHILRRERQFIDHAAHELRTPLAGLKIHAQLAVKQLAATTQDDKGAQRSLGRMIEGVKRSERLIEQLLKLSRLNANTGDTLTFAPVDLVALIQQQWQALTPQCANRELIAPTEAALIVLGDESWLAVVWRNLLANALEYSPPDTPIQWTWQQEGEHINVSLTNTSMQEYGKETLAQLTERFNRGQVGALASAQNPEGAGLGLAMVEEIMALHQGSIKLSQPLPHQFCVTLIGLVGARP